MSQLQEVQPPWKRLPGGPRDHPVTLLTHRGLELKRLKAPSSSGFTIEGTDPRATLDMAGRTVNLLFGTKAAYSTVNTLSGARSLESCQVIGVEGKSITQRFAPPLCCSWREAPFCHSFLVRPQCCRPDPVRDVLQKVGAHLIVENPLLIYL